MRLILFSIATLMTATTIARGLNLAGENVCEEDEKYYVNVTRNVQKNVTVRVYVWCMNIPPRCSTFKFKTYTDKQIQQEERTRKVPVCCDGFEPDANREKCVSKCDDCVNGICDEERKCYCHPGFRGDHCERGCEFSRWGRYCRYHCACERGECDPVNGHCKCPNGWRGPRCEHHCADGHYGHQCKERCRCPDGEFCSPTDGRCLSKDKIPSTDSIRNDTKSQIGISLVNIGRPPQSKTSLVKNENSDTKNIIGVYLLTTTPVVESTEDEVNIILTTENAVKYHEEMVIEDNSNIATEESASIYSSAEMKKAIKQPNSSKITSNGIERNTDNPIKEISSKSSQNKNDRHGKSFSTEETHLGKSVEGVIASTKNTSVDFNDGENFGSNITKVDLRTIKTEEPDSAKSWISVFEKVAESNFTQTDRDKSESNIQIDVLEKVNTTPKRNTSASDYENVKTSLINASNYEDVKTNLKSSSDYENVKTNLKNASDYGNLKTPWKNANNFGNVGTSLNGGSDSKSTNATLKEANSLDQLYVSPVNQSSVDFPEQNFENPPTNASVLTQEVTLPPKNVETVNGDPFFKKVLQEVPTDASKEDDDDTLVDMMKRNVPFLERKQFSSSATNSQTSLSIALEDLLKIQRDSSPIGFVDRTNIRPTSLEEHLGKKSSMEDSAPASNMEDVSSRHPSNYEDVLRKKSSSSTGISEEEVHFTFTRNALVGIVSTALAIFVFVLGAGFYATARIKENVLNESKRQRRMVKMEDEENGECKEYAFGAKSIFHFPLPDPPDNYSESTIKSLDKNTTLKSFSTTTESTYKSSIDYLELFYDQPPSRGTSYRSTIPPQPPSPTIKQKEDDASTAILEPIYDEIPSQSEQNCAIYANANPEEIITQF